MGLLGWLSGERSVKYVVRVTTPMLAKGIGTPGNLGVSGNREFADRKAAVRFANEVASFWRQCGYEVKGSVRGKDDCYVTSDNDGFIFLDEVRA